MPHVRLACRWGEDNFMSMLLRELDRGPAALPRGPLLPLPLWPMQIVKINTSILLNPNKCRRDE